MLCANSTYVGSTSDDRYEDGFERREKWVRRAEIEFAKLRYRYVLPGLTEVR